MPEKDTQKTNKDANADPNDEWTHEHDHMDDIPYAAFPYIGDCFVATTVYGDPNAPEVQKFRKIRDNVLMQNPVGRIFVRAYYGGLGKGAANVLSAIPFAIPVIKRGLDKIADSY